MGGFVQLVSLIETFGPAKREKFLEMIDDESPAWASALREKMLTVDKLVGWSDDALLKVLRQMPLKSQVYALEAFPAVLKARLLEALSNLERRRLVDLLAESNPKQEEILAQAAKYIETARRMLLDREIPVDRVDPALVIADGIELKLDGGGLHATPGQQPPTLVATPPAAQSAAPEPKVSSSNDVTKLRADLKSAQRENQALRDEVIKLREKLDLVRRAAA